MPLPSTASNAKERASTAVEPEVVLDLLGTHWVQGAGQSQSVFARAVIDSVHPRKRHCCEENTSQVPIVPLHTVLVHHVPAACKAALGEHGRLDIHHRSTGQLQCPTHRHPEMLLSKPVPLA